MTIICIVIVGQLIYKPIFNFGYELVKENMKGLASVEYIRQDSSLNFKSDNSSKDIAFEGQVKFQNYSKDVKFLARNNIKVQNSNGSVCGLDLVIFTDNDEEKFIKGTSNIMFL